MHLQDTRVLLHWHWANYWSLIGPVNGFGHLDWNSLRSPTPTHFASGESEHNMLVIATVPLLQMCSPWPINAPGLNRWRCVCVQTLWPVQVTWSIWWAKFLILFVVSIEEWFLLDGGTFLAFCRCHRWEVPGVSIGREMGFFASDPRTVWNIPTLLHQKWNVFKWYIIERMSNNIIPSNWSIVSSIVGVRLTFWFRFRMSVHIWIESLIHMMLTRSSS